MVDGGAIVIQRRHVSVSLVPPFPFPFFSFFPYPGTNRGSNFSLRYVAMHTMQEEDSKQSNNNTTILEDAGSNGYIDGGHLRDRSQGVGAASEGRSLKLVLAAVGGMLLPLITQIGHAH